MENHEFRGIRESLGLSREQLMVVLEYKHIMQIAELERETNPKPVPRHVAKLMRAYDEGYRPKDWPK